MSAPHCESHIDVLKLPDPYGMNSERIAWASRTLNYFVRISACDRESALADLLADLMHFSAQAGFDFGRELSRAEFFFDMETEGGGR